jgi:hypothetical protein
MGYATVKIVVKDGMVDRVFADDPVSVEIIDLDTDDEEELAELEAEVRYCEDNYLDLY